ncbi:LPS export ABC transporter periplasmic protein LptC [Marimonas arenosa]|nr:hypothetical protein [Marimonas arenosa]
MFSHDNLYSRIVAWLKILLPVAALFVLASLFLFSKSIDPITTVPFSSIDLRDRARKEQLTEPELLGASNKGDLISFRAAEARPDPESASRALLDDPNARIDFSSGTTVSFRASRGSVDQSGTNAELIGDVVIENTLDYVVRTERLIFAIRELRAEAPEQIQGHGPLGRFTAGRMLLEDRSTPNSGESDFHLLFTDGVKLLYDPKETKE